MMNLLAEQVRPAILNDVRPPGILLKAGKFGASFLVVGDEVDPDVVMLDGDYKFHSFKRSAGGNYFGLAVENVQFELDAASAFETSGFRKIAGTLVRSADRLGIVAISDDNFRRAIEVPILAGLAEGSSNQAVAFAGWRTFVMVGEEKRVIWGCSVPLNPE